MRDGCVSQGGGSDSSPLRVTSHVTLLERVIRTDQTQQSVPRSVGADRVDDWHAGRSQGRQQATGVADQRSEPETIQSQRRAQVESVGDFRQGSEMKEPRRAAPSLMPVVLILPSRSPRVQVCLVIRPESIASERE
jgi:hypothetical protein